MGSIGMFGLPNYDPLLLDPKPATPQESVQRWHSRDDGYTGTQDDHREGFSAYEDGMP